MVSSELFIDQYLLLIYVGKRVPSFSRRQLRSAFEDFKIRLNYLFN